MTPRKPKKKPAVNGVSSPPPADADARSPTVKVGDRVDYTPPGADTSLPATVTVVKSGGKVDLKLDVPSTNQHFLNVLATNVVPRTPRSKA